MLYKKTDSYELYHGQMQDELSSFEENSIDSIVTDPPYELNFMNKGWDNSGIAFQKETWRKCYEVLKPGGHLLAFGGTRTFHRIACAIEDAGFEIRDTIMWIYGSGFPKSMNLGKTIDNKLGNERIKTGRILHHAQKGVAVAEERGAIGGGAFGIAHDEEETIGNSIWEGWGTALKPSFEPIIVARKPLDGTVASNCLKWGVGGINIDECRVEVEANRRMCGNTKKGGETSFILGAREETYTNKGRFPANTILTYDDTDFDEVCGGFPDTKSTGGSGECSIHSGLNGNVYMGGWNHQQAGEHFGGLGDEGSASRYFYCAKASKKDRDEGLDEFNAKYMAYSNQAQAELKRGNTEFNGDKFNKVQVIKNIHPTVKPTSLMQYLVRLVSPKGATILDPFMGSGSTGKAVMFENRERNADYKFIGIEMTEDYLPICEARINYAMTYVYNDDVKQISNETAAVVKQEKVSLW